MTIVLLVVQTDKSVLKRSTSIRKLIKVLLDY